jgi:hypothetical protein
MATTVSFKRVLQVSGAGGGLTLGSLRALVEQSNSLGMPDEAMVLDGSDADGGKQLDYLEVQAN